MARVIVTAEVENSADWAAAYKTHGDLFKQYSATAIHFATTEDNFVVTYWEADDLDQFMAQMESPSTAEAMESDGVKRDSVQIYVLDQEVDL